MVLFLNRLELKENRTTAKKKRRQTVQSTECRYQTFPTLFSPFLRCTCIINSMRMQLQLQLQLFIPRCCHSMCLLLATP